jgi:hypothetical protein
MHLQTIGWYGFLEVNMKLAQLSNPLFHSAMEKLAKEPLPIRVAFRLKGIIKKVNEEFAKYEQTRMDALKRNAQKREDGSLELDEQGNAKFLAPENLQSFVKDLAELSNEEVQLLNIKISELGPSVNMSAADLELLDGVLVEE